MYSFASKEADYARYYVMVSTFTLSESKKKTKFKVCHEVWIDHSLKIHCHVNNGRLVSY